MTPKKIDKLILKMVDKIKAEYQPEKIILFGSYAYGRPTRNSDIDLFVIKNDSRRPLERSVEVRRILREENRQVALTVLIYTPEEVKYRLSMGDDFIEEILTKGQVLYEKNSGEGCSGVV